MKTPTNSSLSRFLAGAALALALTAGFVTAGAAARASLRQAYSGHPALYGRFQGTTRAGQWTPPASTLALNPYSRPQAPARAGELPRGAQLLSTVRQTPGGGRDLYASPDGNVYQRRNDGWYRRQAGGNLNFYAPTQGQVQRGQVGSATGTQPAGAGSANRIASTANASAARAQAFRERAPNAGGEARAAEVAALERQHYARALGQARAQNSRPAGNVSRPARSGGGGRR